MTASPIASRHGSAKPNGTALGSVGNIELQEGVAIAAGIHAVQLVPAACLASVLLAIHFATRRRPTPESS